MPDIKSVTRIAPDDTTDLFERLAEEAHRGDLVGAVVICMYSRSTRAHTRPYMLSLTGWASRDPTYALGAMTACQALVQELALEDARLV